jgi:hypothetical protein
MLERLPSKRHGEAPGDSVMHVRECQEAMDKAAKVIGDPPKKN